MENYHRYYDAIYASKDYAGEARVASELLLGPGCSEPGRLVDVGCGTGTHALELAALGWDVTGIDIDAAAIEVARRKASGPNAPRFLRTAVADLSEEGFSAAVSLFNVVNYLETDAELDDFCSGVSKRLAGSAGFVFDCWNGAAALRDPPRRERRTVSAGGDTFEILSEPRLDRENRRVDMTHRVTVDPAGISFEYAYRSRLWTPDELSRHLTRAGFGVRRICTWREPQRPAGPDDWKLLFVCWRRA